MPRHRINPEDVKARLSAVDVAEYLGLEHKREGGVFKALCPFHEETTPSLVLYPGKGSGKGSGFKCFGGCGETGDVIALYQGIKGGGFPEALETLAGLAGVNGNGNGDSVSVRSTPASELRATRKAQPETWTPSSEPPADLRHPKRGKPSKTSPLRDPHGRLFAVHVRFDLPDGKKDVVWWRNGRWNLGGISTRLAPLYGSENLPSYDTAAPLVLCEGEPACDALTGLGVQAVATCGTSSTPAAAVLKCLEPFQDLILWPDADEGGRKHMGQVLKALGKGRIFDPELPNKGDDAVEWTALQNGPKQAREALLSAFVDLPKPEPVKRRRRRTAEASDWDDSYTFTDAANGERFARRHRNGFRYVPAFSAWLEWNGYKWTDDERHAALGAAKDTAKAIYQEAAQAESKDAAKALAHHADRSLSRRQIESMLSLARTGLSAAPADFDADPWELNTPTGVLNLKTETLQPHGDGDTVRPMVTKATGARYDRGATCPRWEQFLTEIFLQPDGTPDLDLQAFVQRAVGYSLTGSTEEHALFLLHGEGSNGKSVFVETLGALLGDYGNTLAFSALLHSSRSGGPSEDVAALKGCRVAWASESSSGARFSESIVKQLTGGDSISARRMYGRLFTFKPQHKLWLACNHVPRSYDASRGFWRRIQLIPFRAIFKPAHECQGPQDKPQDPKLLDTLRGELPGILSWALDGLEWWIGDGLGTCPAVSEATAEYRESQDPLAAFLAERCDVGAGLSVPYKALWRAYTGWAESSGEDALPSGAFQEHLADRGFRARKSGGKRLRQGLRLRPESAP